MYCVQFGQEVGQNGGPGGNSRRRSWLILCLCVHNLQMENLTNFVKFCEAYGVPKTGLFQTVDIFEGRNMPQFMNCLIQLGTEVGISRSPATASQEFTILNIPPVPSVKTWKQPNTLS